MRYFTEAQWLTEKLTGRYGDNPCNRYRVEQGSLPESYLGRRTIIVYEENHPTLLVEGFDFMVDDEEGRTVPWHEEFYFIDVMFGNFTSVCVRTKRGTYDIEDLEKFVADDAQRNGGFWYATDISEDFRLFSCLFRHFCRFRQNSLFLSAATVFSLLDFCR